MRLEKDFEARGVSKPACDARREALIAELMSIDAAQARTNRRA